MARFFQKFSKNLIFGVFRTIEIFVFLIFVFFHTGSEPNVYYRLQSGHESKTSTAADYQYESFYECRNALILFAKMIYVPHGSGY